MRYAKTAIALTAAAATCLSVAAAAPASAAATPAKISNVHSVAGPGVGEITITFDSSNANTSGYKVVTGLTTFGSKGLPSSGRDKHTFNFSGKRHSITLSAAQVAAAGAAPATANHLYFRLYATNGGTTRAYPYLQAAIAKPESPKADGTDLRFATFNVRTARGHDARSWLKRATDVAREIADRDPGIVAVQELGPGRADGVTGSLNGHMRQTESLEKAMASVGAGQYKLTRTTSYVKPGTKHGTQGARILYNTDQYKLLSDCVETTGKSNYSSSCAVELPLNAGDSKGLQRSAAFAEFQNRRTGKRFFVVSVHLDDRHSGKLSTEHKYNALRGKQMAKVYNTIDALNSRGEQVIIAGDLNSWQNNKGGNAPHDYLVDKGFYDTAAAQTKVNFQYATINHFAKTMAVAPQGYGVRIDAIMVKGSRGAKKFENVMKKTDSARASDHNLVISDLVL